MLKRRTTTGQPGESCVSYRTLEYNYRVDNTVIARRPFRQPHACDTAQFKLFAETVFVVQNIELNSNGRSTGIVKIVSEYNRFIRKNRLGFTRHTIVRQALK